MIFNNFNSRFPLKKNFFHLVSNVFYFSLLIKKLIRFIYIKVAIINNKTIDIKEVIEKGEAYQNLIFEGEIFNFSPKLDILNKKSICFPKGTYQVPNYYIYNFKNCFIKAFSNSIFDKYGRKIRGIDFQELTFDFHIIWDLGKINLNYIDGVVLVLGIGSLEKNYSHAWTELAARAFASSFSNFAYDYVLIDYENEFSREIIKLIGISEKKIIVSSRYEYIAAKQILYPQLINNFAEYFFIQTFFCQVLQYSCSVTCASA